VKAPEIAFSTNPVSGLKILNHKGRGVEYNEGFFKK
jgi:hypothetical protein